MTRQFKDFCGILSEEALRKNFPLIYELLDEIIDFGFIQGTSTESLKSYVHNEPVLTDGVSTKSSDGSSIAPAAISNVISGGKNNHTTASAGRSAPSSASNKPVTVNFAADRNRKNEIFVDVIETITVTLSGTGTVLRSEIDGSIVMKAFIAGNPELVMGVSDDLRIGPEAVANASPYQLVRPWDDANFNDCVRWNELDTMHTLNFKPPDGEFIFLNYRITDNIKLPFTIYPYLVDDMGPGRMDLVIKVKAEFPTTNHANNWEVTVPVPPFATSVGTEVNPGVTGQSAEFKSAERRVKWSIAKFPGGTDQVLRIKMSVSNPAPPVDAVKRELGPISASFEVPLYNPSGFQIKFLKLADRSVPKEYNPLKWVRYLTKSSSYVSRLN